jgi:hypothetical protein
MASDIIGRAKVIVEGVVDTTSAAKSGKSLGTILKKSALVGSLALSGLAVGGVKAALAFEEAEAVSKKLNNTLKNMGKVKAAPTVSKLADELSRLTGVDDEVIRGGQTILATFSEIAASAGETGGAFERATKASVDLAATGFGNVESASVMLGKALQDPVKGVSALGEAGVTFSEIQKKQIENFVKTGEVAKAQNVILGEVEKQVEGNAAAAAKQSERLKVATGELEESFGKLITTATDGKVKNLPDAIFALADAVDEFAESDGLEKFSKFMADLGKSEFVETNVEIQTSNLKTLGDAFAYLTDEGVRHQAWIKENQRFTEEGDVFGTYKFEDLQADFREGWAGLKTTWSAETETFGEFIEQKKEDTKTQFKNYGDAFDTIGQEFQASWGEFKKDTRKKFDGFVADVKAVPGKIKAQASEWRSASATLIREFIAGLGSSVVDAGVDLAESFRSSINRGLRLPRSITLGGKLGVPEVNFTIPALASGTRTFGGGMARVGERGPETVYLPQGSSVANNSDTRRRDARGGDGGNTFNFYDYGPRNDSGKKREIDFVRTYGARYGTGRLATG